ncbi:MAG: DEAD/DEAH box helicase [Firmicutes bacterium]|nr:DEAD/DEAH box helicase [Bacillota bacterium]
MIQQIQMPIRAAPYAHQQEAFTFATRLFTEDASPGAALLMEMGTGKTITSIAIAGALWQTGRAKRALIVAPLSILGVWEEEFAKWADFPYTLQVLTGSSEQKAQALGRITGPGLQVAVVNYESAWRLEEALLGWKPDLVIADESHKIKSHTTNASKFMHKFGNEKCFKLLLTGTIITNKAVDVYSQYRFLNPAIYGTSFYRFRSRYFEQGYFPSQLALKKHMEPEFTQRLHCIAFRATKADCLDLPPMVDIIRLVDLEPKALKAYRDLVRDSFAELSAEDTVTASNILTRLMRLSQLTGGFIKPDDGKLQQISKAKLAALEDIVEQVTEEGGKLVVVARFVPEIDAICKLLEQKQIRCSCVRGDVKDRKEQIAAFQNDPEVQVFVGQIATAGQGITLTAASTMVLYSTDYSMSNHEQVRARIHRVGQDHKCTYIYLTARGTVDEKVLRALREKADLARTLVDDYRNGGNPYG